MDIDDLKKWTSWLGEGHIFLHNTNNDDGFWVSTARRSNISAYNMYPYIYETRVFRGQHNGYHETTVIAEKARKIHYEVIDLVLDAARRQKPQEPNESDYYRAITGDR